MRRLTAAVSAIACLGVLAGTTASAEARPVVVAETAEKQTPQGKYQRQAHTATNKQRVAHDLDKVRRAACVQLFAVRHAKAMAQREEMFHQDLGPVLKECGLNAGGENVAYGYPNGRSVVNDGWMGSDGHRDNILNPIYTLVGIGARKGHDGRWYAAQVFGRPS